MIHRHRTPARAALAFCLAVGVAALSGVAAQAHHAASAEFDLGKTLTFEGVLTGVKWTNPHSSIDVTRTLPDGSTESITVMTVGTAAMRTMGIGNAGVFKVGDRYKIVANPSRSGVKRMLMETITFPDGRVVELGGG
jgi:hypothetical protein